MVIQTVKEEKKMKNKNQENEKSFIVVWHYCANYGMNEVKASGVEE